MPSGVHQMAYIPSRNDNDIMPDIVKIEENFGFKGSFTVQKYRKIIVIWTYKIGFKRKYFFILIENPNFFGVCRDP